MQQVDGCVCSRIGYRWLYMYKLCVGGECNAMYVYHAAEPLVHNK